MEASATLCQLLLDDLRVLRSQSLPDTLACIYRYPDDSHHKGVSGIAVQNALGWPPVKVFSVMEDETVSDCFTYSTTTGPTAGLAIRQLEMTLLQHTIFLADLLKVGRSEIVRHWMVALAKTDIGYSPDSMPDFGSDGITKGTIAAVPNVINASIVLLTILTGGTEIDDSKGDPGAAPVPELLEAVDVELPVSSVSISQGIPSVETEHELAEPQLETLAQDSRPLSESAVGMRLEQKHSPNNQAAHSTAHSEAETGALTRESVTIPSAVPNRKKRLWRPEYKSIVKAWCRKMEKNGRAIPRATFIKEFLADKSGVALWGERSGRTIIEAFKSHHNEWEEQVNAVKASLKSGSPG